MPVEQCRQFELELYQFMDNAHRDIWEEMRQKRALDDMLRNKMKAAIQEFKDRFTAEHAASARA
jgi:F-type H+/Na+-transporting ATPase subunit alpha